jgi:glycosyltransferase involved in cell wall biosynthesis
MTGDLFAVFGRQGNAAALVFPIDWPEPFSLVLIEAMACGTPVIAYPFGSVPELVDHGKSGFLAEDTPAAVSMVKKIDEIDRARCRQVFEGRFTAARMAADYVTLYTQVISEETIPLESEFSEGSETK